MNIAFLLPVNGNSGGINVILHHANCLSMVGHKVSIIFIKRNKGKKIRFSSLSTSFFDESKNSIYDVLVATWWETFYYLMFFKFKKAFYFIQSDERRFYEESDFFKKKFVNFTYENNTIEKITMAKWIKKFFQEEYLQNIKVLPNGINSEIFKLNINPIEKKTKKKRVLVEGSPTQSYKNIDLAFEILSHFEDIQVWYVSPDYYMPKNYKYHRIFFNLSQFEMAKVYSSCDILLKTSNLESFSYPILEMLICGGIVVSSNVNGIEEFGDFKDLIYIFPIGNLEKGISTLKIALNDTTIRDKIVKENLNLISNFAWKNYNENEFVKLVNELDITNLTHKSLDDQDTLTYYNFLTVEDSINEINSMRKQLEPFYIKIGIKLKRLIRYIFQLLKI